MSASRAGGETFQEKVCRHFDVPAERYVEIVLRFTLYPHARCLLPFTAGDALELDRAFVAAVGRLTRWRGFAGAVWDFQHDNQSRRFRRRVLRLRVSVARMRMLFSEIWGKSAPADEESSPPLFARDAGSFLTD